MQFTLKVFSLVTIENERAIILGPRDVTFPCPFGAENRQLFARVCARSIAPSVVLSMICAIASVDRDTCIPMGARTPKDSSLKRLQERNRRKREPAPQMNSSG